MKHGKTDKDIHNLRQEIEVSHKNSFLLHDSMMLANLFQVLGKQCIRGVVVIINLVYLELVGSKNVLIEMQLGLYGCLLLEVFLCLGLGGRFTVWYGEDQRMWNKESLWFLLFVSVDLWSKHFAIELRKSLLLLFDLLWHIGLALIMSNSNVFSMKEVESVFLCFWLVSRGKIIWFNQPSLKLVNVECNGSIGMHELDSN